MESHYTEVTEAVPSDATCMICEDVTGQGDRGRLMPVSKRIDNSGRVNFVHARCMYIEPRQSSAENIWAFASKFKYYANTMNSESPEPTVQETFPSVDMPKEEPAMTTEVKQKSSDGAPVPPKPF